MTDPQHPTMRPYGEATQPMHGYSGAPAEPRTLSIVSLVLGLASIFIGGSILVPIAGIVVGVMARKREPAGRTMALWGIWLSVAMLVLWALLWIVAGGLILAAIGLAGASV
ncbi:DUF4190 domain-containing protein [Agrococcus beijingensis]|uniref:DUF4190 domain-containing protein n=1 Tax=Agrococcus beijingensis TaxID=3068634 RepID=UPI0027407B3F|nr:DUF4190 domain-containing protein [Agrococcus sp. REN33]